MSNNFAASLQIRQRLHFYIRHRNISLISHRPSRAKGKMAAQINGSMPVPADASLENAPRKLKILMLHGYTQNGPLFHAKTRGLEKLLMKAFPSTSASPLKATYPGGIQLLYPTAPIRLLPADIPGFNINDAQGDTESDAWGWWKRETGSGKYLGLEIGLDAIAKSIKEAGGVDGVIGFSQGAAAAAMVASLLEPGRKEAFEKAGKGVEGALAFPESWEGLQEEGRLKFAVSYSGFYAPNELYTGLYDPKIKTQVLHFIGSLDSVVEESRSLALVNICTKENKVYHPGGHFVPIGKEMARLVVGFIRECCTEKPKEESVEDMDVPF